MDTKNIDQIITMLISDNINDVRLGVDLFRANEQFIDFEAFEKQLQSHTKLIKGDKLYLTYTKEGKHISKVVEEKPIWTKVSGHPKWKYWLERNINGIGFRIYNKQ